MSDDLRIVWVPPTGTDNIEMTPDGEYRLMDIQGFGYVPNEPIEHSAPGQTGTTFIGQTVNSRELRVVLELDAESWGDLWDMRRRFARAFASVPSIPGERPRAGIVRVFQSGQEAVEIDAVLSNSGDPVLEPAAHYAETELLFIAPYPYWREVSDRRVDLVADALGLEYPMVFPFEIPAGFPEANVVNSGDVPASIEVRIRGEVVNPQITNLTTGHTLALDAHVAEGEQVVIVTAFGAKSITHIAADGTESNLMSAIDLDESDFWVLEPGNNHVRFDASNNVSGDARLTWRNRWAGV